MLGHIPTIVKTLMGIPSKYISSFYVCAERTISPVFHLGLYKKCLECFQNKGNQLSLTMLLGCGTVFRLIHH